MVEWLQRRFGSRSLGLPAAASRRALRDAVERGVRGGALYDALIAAAAVHHGLTLVSADRRAAPVYSALGADVRYVEAG